MKKRSKEKKKRDRVEEERFVMRRRSTRRRFDWKSPVSYVNHMEEDENETKEVKTWKQFVEQIGDEKLTSLPLCQQAKNDCSICSVVTAWEIQNGSKFSKRLDELGSYRKTKEHGAHLEAQLPRVWGKAKSTSRPYSMCRLKTRLTLEDLIENVRKGVVVMGIEELGYPWANRAVKDEYGAKESFIAPRYDPYNNPWEPSRRSGADGHACCVIGMFHCEDKWGDGAPKGYPRRDPREKIGNVFVTKDTVLPCGWNDPKRPFTKSLAGKTKRPREEFAYSLIPFDIFTTPIQSGEVHRRAINEAWFVPLLR